MHAVSSAIILFSALTALALSHNDRRDHAGLAKRIDNQLEKRGAYTNARFTWYPTDTGPDACTGKNHQDSDWYVALNMPLFGNSGNGHCMKQIKITANGKSTTATIVDACATCYSASDIDMTKGLFEFFDGNLGDGVFHGSWEFVDGSSDGGDNSDNQSPTTHHSTTKPHTTTHYTPPPPPPTTHYTPQYTPKSSSSSHHDPQTTSTSTRSTTSSTSTSKTSSSSTSVSPSTTPSTTSTISSTTSVVISTPSTTPAAYTNVANAGTDPVTTTDAGGIIQGGISDNHGSDSGSMRLAFSKAALSLTAIVLVAVQAL